MKRDKILAILCILLGLALVAGSALLLLHNIREDRMAAQSAQRAMAALETAAVSQTEQATLPAETAAPTTVPTEAPTETVEETTEATDPTDPPDLSSYFLEGHEYVGYLLFPSLDRKLPVMKIAYLEDLQIAPCLEKGSPHTDDAVISAHNYPAHFGPIRDWVGGEEVEFLTLEGETIHYTVSLVATIEPTDVLTVMESEHDLVLYTCTTGGQKRVMIACDRVTE